MSDETIPELRSEVAEDYDRWAEERKLDFFYERVYQPERGLAAEWDAYCRHVVQVDAHVGERKEAVLRQFDEEIAHLPAAEASKRLWDAAEHWFPGFTASNQRDFADIADDVWAGFSDEERLQYAIEGIRPPYRRDLAEERRCAAEDAASARTHR